MTDRPDPYAALAAIYDDWQERHGAFWRLVLPRLGPLLDEVAAAGDDPSFLDVACGTGALLGALRQERPGFRLAGTDGSPAMIARARQRAGDLTFAVVPFGGLIPGPPFAAAGCFFDALNHAPGPAALEAAFERIGGALRSGGPFVFDLNNRRGFQAWWNGRRVHPGAGYTLVIDARFDEGTGRASGRATLHRRLPPRPTEVTTVEEWCFEDAAVLAALERTGFTVESATPWAPVPGDVAGKTWWVARRR